MTDSILPEVSQDWEVAKLFSQFGEEFLEKHPQPHENYSSIRLIQSCRTAKLGGHLQRCDHCDYSKPMYNSCRSRMCPKCQSLKRERWVEARKKEVLPCKYFHGVFTLPHSLNPLALWNKKLIYKLLFETVSETLQIFAFKELGGRLGFISVLHTWNQKVLDHFHLHCLIPAGAVQPKTGNWIPCRRSEFLFPVRALSQVFRAKFLEKLKARYFELKIPTQLGYLKDEASFQNFLDSLWNEAFVVYTKQPFSGAEQVIEYLGRYVHRVAISNNRIQKCEKNEVSFKYRDRTDGNQEKIETVQATEFLRRFMLHSLPKGFQRIRYHGFLANRAKDKNITRIYQALEKKRPAHSDTQPITAKEFVLKRFGVDITRCPVCSKGSLHQSTSAPKARPP
jgi:hypothetical protein